MPNRDHIIRTPILRPCRQTIRDIRLLHPQEQRVDRNLENRREPLENLIRTAATVTMSRLNSVGDLLAMIDLLPAGNAHDWC
jgi:hypothetical protein